MTEKNGDGDSLQFSTKMVSPGGMSVLAVWRFKLSTEDMDEPGQMADLLFSTMAAFEISMKEAGWLALTSSFSGQDVRSLPPADAPKRPIRQQPRGSGDGGWTPPGPTQAPQLDDAAFKEYWPEHEQFKIGMLEKIVIESKGADKSRIGFHVAGRQKPMYDNRGPVVVAGLFKDECWSDAWTADHLKNTDVIYSADAFGELEVLTAKGKYWDVLMIRKAKP